MHVELLRSLQLLYHFPFSPAGHEDSGSSIPLPTLGVVSVSNVSRPEICVLVSHCDLNLHFPKS